MKWSTAVLVIAALLLSLLAKSVVLKLFLLQRLWKSLKLRRTSNRMLINRKFYLLMKQKNRYNLMLFVGLLIFYKVR